MGNELQIFNYGGQEVRTIIRDGEPWWVAKDICDVFGETNRNRAMQSLDADEKGYTQMTTPGGNQQLAIVNEPGLYSLLFSMQPSKARGVSDDYISTREEALRNFKRWVTHEVLPAIRKTGGYIPVHENETNEQLFARALLVAQKTIEQKDQLLEAQRPKVLFADAVSTSDTTILVGELAKILKGNGVDIGQNRLFERLRQDGFLICRKGSDHNMPTQKSMELGLFQIKETAVNHSDGHVTVNKTPKVTGKGQQYFVDYFLSTTQNINAGGVCNA